jgi:uncharacterized membrane protein
MTDAAPTPPVVKPRRWPYVLLVASLALNALLAGAVLRSLWHLRANVAMTGGGVEMRLPAFVNSLPANRQDALRHNGQFERPGLQQPPLRVEIRRARADAARLFTADPFDKQAFIAAQSRLFEAENQLRLTIQRTLPEIGEQMTAAERRAYLSWRAPHAFNGRRPGARGGRFDEPGGGMGRGMGDDGPRRP